MNKTCLSFITTTICLLVIFGFINCSNPQRARNETIFDNIPNNSTDIKNHYSSIGDYEEVTKEWLLKYGKEECWIKDLPPFIVAVKSKEKDKSKLDPDEIWYYGEEFYDDILDTTYSSIKSIICFYRPEGQEISGAELNDRKFPGGFDELHTFVVSQTQDSTIVPSKARIVKNNPFVEKVMNCTGEHPNLIGFYQNDYYKNNTSDPYICSEVLTFCEKKDKGLYEASYVVRIILQYF